MLSRRFRLGWLCLITVVFCSMLPTKHPVHAVPAAQAQDEVVLPGYNGDMFDTKDTEGWVWSGQHTVPFHDQAGSVLRSRGSGSDYNTNVARSAFGLTADMQAQVRFKVDHTDTWAHFSIETDDLSYERVGVIAHSGQLHVQYAVGDRYMYPGVLLPSVEIDTWYSLRFVITDAEIIVEAYKEADPATLRSYAIEVQTDQNWRFHHWIYRGYAYLDDYQELSSPNQTMTGSAPFTDFFDARAIHNWRYSGFHTAPYVEGSQTMLRTTGTGQDYTSNVARSTYSLFTGATAQLRFQVDSQSTYAHFSIEANNENDDRVGMVAHEGRLDVYSVIQGKYKNLGELLPGIQVNEWYVARFIIDDVAGVTIEVYQASNQTIKAAYSLSVPANQRWRFHHWIHLHTALIDDYYETVPPQMSPTLSPPFNDLFDERNNAEWHWSGYTTVPLLNGANDVIRTKGTGHDYTTSLVRSAYSLTNGTMVQVRFKVQSTDTHAHFAIEADDSSYDRVGVIARGGQLDLQFIINDKQHYPGPLLSALQTDTWYVVRFTVQQLSTVTVSVHQEADPSVKGMYTVSVPRDSRWRFHHWIYQNTALLDDYGEVVLPKQPLNSPFADDFHTWAANAWWLNGYATIPVVDGEASVLRTTGGDDWDTQVARTVYSLAGGTDVSLRFKVSDANSGAHYAIEADDPTYRRFGIIAQDGRLDVQRIDGDSVQTLGTILPSVRPHTWYRATFHLDDSTGFRVLVEQEDDPGVNGTLTAMMPAGHVWRFHHWIYRGTSALDDYQETGSTPARLAVNIDKPTSIADGGVGTFQIRFTNWGSTPMAVPLFQLISRGGAPIALEAEHIARGATTLHLLLQAPNTPLDILPSGASGSITVYTQATAPLDFALTPVPLSDPIPWDELKPAYQQEGIDQARFDAYWQALRAQLGETGAELRANVLAGQQSLQLISSGNSTATDVYALAEFQASEATKLGLPLQSLRRQSSDLLSLSAQSVYPSASCPPVLSSSIDPGAVRLHLVDLDTDDRERVLPAASGVPAARRDTYIITHGFNNGGGKNNDNDKLWDEDYPLPEVWIQRTAAGIKERYPDANVVIVDWREGAHMNINYPRAAYNTHITGLRIAEQIRAWGIAPSKLHLIGHSLGAQVSSFASDYIECFGLGKVKRIIALDPAGPGFGNEVTDDPRLGGLFAGHGGRIDASDAVFVDVYNTSKLGGGGYGRSNFDVYDQAYVDREVREIDAQPGCFSLVCSHSYAHQLFAASLRCKDEGFLPRTTDGTVLGWYTPSQLPMQNYVYAASVTGEDLDLCSNVATIHKLSSKNTTFTYRDALNTPPGPTLTEDITTVGSEKRADSTAAHLVGIAQANLWLAWPTGITGSDQQVRYPFVIWTINR
jgi:hypothetical protein